MIFQRVTSLACIAHRRKENLSRLVGRQVLQEVNQSLTSGRGWQRWGSQQSTHEGDFLFCWMCNIITIMQAPDYS